MIMNGTVITIYKPEQWKLCTENYTRPKSDVSVPLRNYRDIATLQRAIRHIPGLLDSAMASLVETNIRPPEVEVSRLFFSLCLPTLYLFGYFMTSGTPQ